MNTEIVVQSDLFHSITVKAHIGDAPIPSFDILMGGGGIGLSTEAVYELIALLQHAVELGNKRDW